MDEISEYTIRTTKKESRMVNDQQVRRLRKLMQKENSIETAALKSGMCEKTARKYLHSGKLPSEMKKERDWVTRKNPFEEVWGEITSLLDLNPGLQAKTIFGHLQRKYTGRFQDGQLRTLQRYIKKWRALEGPAKEVFFPQIHRPGELAQSDFTSMNNLGITINKVPFKHLVYHFVLTYSNWETGSICFSESFESLSEGMQEALWKLGGAPTCHQTDRLSAAVNNNCNAAEFTHRYEELLKHYGLSGKKIRPGKANENGDVEQSHRRFKEALDQSLMLRGSRDFNSRAEYRDFLNNLFDQLNSGRSKRFQEEVQALNSLPSAKLDASKRYDTKVGPSSTINIGHNTYSVNSRLIGERITAKMTASTIEIWYAQKCVDVLPRLRGSGKSRIHYRHIIDSLIRKPGAFENYRYREELFPTHRFRMAYDSLKKNGSKGTREYLKILYLAAYESEAKVDAALQECIEKHSRITSNLIEEMIKEKSSILSLKTPEVEDVDLKSYDQLLSRRQAL
jgi:hypothetical protein